MVEPSQGDMISVDSFWDL